jgi:DNA-binding MarR family transcriptional regulator
MAPIQSFDELPTWLLSRAAARSHRILHAELAQLGASGYDFRVLSVLATTGACSQRALGDAAALDRRDISLTVRGLEAAALLSRRPDPQDARRTMVAITLLGQHRLAELSLALERVQRAVFSPLSAAETDTLSMLLARLATG